MAIEDADRSDTDGLAGDSASTSDGPKHGSSVRVGEYTWADFMEEYGHGNEVSTLYPKGVNRSSRLGLGSSDKRQTAPHGSDWDGVDFDPKEYLGYHPDELPELVTEYAGANAKYLQSVFDDYLDLETTPVVKDIYRMEHYKLEFYYDSDGSLPTNIRGEVKPFDCESTLGFAPEDVEEVVGRQGAIGEAIYDLVDQRTVTVREDFDEDEFFSTSEGHPTVVNRYDLEKAVPLSKKGHFREAERYWVNKPYAFVIIFHSEKENEKKYYMIEPYLNELESDVRDFLSGKLRTAIKYADDEVKVESDEDARREVIERETNRLLRRYDLFKRPEREKKGFFATLREMLDDEDEPVDRDVPDPFDRELEGMTVRPEPLLLEEDADMLTEYQVEKLLYLLKRDFIGYERIDGIKYDINVEDISCDGYNSPVFVYHSEYEQIISNIHHGEKELDDFVVKLAQRSGKGISKRLPQVDATLPDGSRAQLTLGTEVSDHGTNYTIRQFKDVPFTPIDLINWNTFSLDEMAFLWLCIENNKSLIFAGGTASGKTTSLNAVSLFIPSNTKIVSIEDTREVELPQRNWIASVTRPSFSDDVTGDVDEFDLLEAALRQRPDYIVMGEIRGEEGRTLFQVMSTGHTTYTTFHADSVDEVLKRFTTAPINVSKTMFTALDLVSVQTQTRVQGTKVRRNKSLTEINHYEAEHDEINVQDVYQWQAETDEYLQMGDSNTLDEIKFDRGWTHEKLERELFKRQVILAYLIKNELNEYAQVAATVQAFINDPDTIMTLIANEQLEESLEDLREMESVLINVDPDKEALVPRPSATDETYNLSMDILERAEDTLFEEYRGLTPSGIATALADVQPADPIEAEPTGDEFEFTETVGDDALGTASADDGDEFTGFGDDFDFGGEGASAGMGELEFDEDFGVGDDRSIEAGDATPALEAGAETDDGGDVGSGGWTSDSPGSQSVGRRPSASAGGSTSRARGRSSDDDLVVESLFTDFTGVLDEMEAIQSGDAEGVGESDEVDTGEFDAMFPEDDFDSIFSSAPDDEATDGAGDAGIFGSSERTTDGPVFDGDDPGDEGAPSGQRQEGGSGGKKIVLDVPSDDENGRDRSDDSSSRSAASPDEDGTDADDDRGSIFEEEEEGDWEFGSDDPSDSLFDEDGDAADENDDAEADR